MSPQSIQLLKRMEQTQLSQVIKQTSVQQEVDDDEDDDEIGYHIESTKY